jgi:hypothetical protein
LLVIKKKKANVVGSVKQEIQQFYLLSIIKNSNVTTNRLKFFGNYFLAEIKKKSEFLEMLESRIRRVQHILL